MVQCVLYYQKPASSSTTLDKQFIGMRENYVNHRTILTWQQQQTATVTLNLRVCQNHMTLCPKCLKWWFQGLSPFILGLKGFNKCEKLNWWDESSELESLRLSAQSLAHPTLNLTERFFWEKRPGAVISRRIGIWHKPYNRFFNIVGTNWCKVHMSKKFRQVIIWH